MMEHFVQLANVSKTILGGWTSLISGLIIVISVSLQTLVSKRSHKAGFAGA